MFKQLYKHHLSRRPIFTPKTYNHDVAFHHASADFSEKMGLIFSQNVLLSGVFDIFRLLKNVLRSFFVYTTTIIFLFSVFLQ